MNELHADHRPVRGRWAPSPTGPLHVGSARTALVVWLSTRAQRGEVIWRIEDLDAARVVPGQADAQQRDLEWLGLDWDASPFLGGLHEPYRQSLRTEHYERALRRLGAVDRLFPCRHSRRDLESLASAPHGEEGAPYPVALRPHTLDPGWLERVLARREPDCAVRFRVDPGEVVWEDLLAGTQRERVERTVGDFVLRRRDGVWAYQLAVVVDDLSMGVTEVVRGFDLIDSTARQILLCEALDRSAPRYGHVPLMQSAETGSKLSKRDGALSLSALRSAGIPPDLLVGYLAHSLGLIDRVEACRPGDLLECFGWQRIRRDPTVVPRDLAHRLLHGAAVRCEAGPV